MTSRLHPAVLLAAVASLAPLSRAQEPCGAVEVLGTFPSVEDARTLMTPVLDGETLFLVHTTEGPNPARTGAVYVIERHPATGDWAEIQRLAPVVDCQHFGHSVVIEGDTLVIGSEPRPWFGGPGRMFVYLRDPATRRWQLAQTVLRPPAWGFPESIVGAGDAVAAYDENVGGTLSKHVEVFRRTPAGTYVSEAIIEPVAPSGPTSFGEAMAFVDEDTLVITDESAHVLLPEADGIAYVFRRGASGTWSVAQTLTSGPASAFGGYAADVRWDGERLLVKAFPYSSHGWSAETWDVFERNASGVFERTGELAPRPVDGVSADFFPQGADSARIEWLRETDALTSAPGRLRPWIADTSTGEWNPGEAAWTFDNSSNFRPYHFAVDGHRVAYILRTLLPGGLVRRNVFVADLGDACGASGRRFCGPALANSTGAGAELDAYTEARAAGAAVSLVARELPVGASCLFLTGRGIGAPAPLGAAGALCLGPTVGRVGAVGTADQAGAIARHVPSAALPLGGAAVPALPGETWAFQLWYRDGAESRLSSATYVVFE